MTMTQADLNGHKTKRQSSDATTDALIDHSNQLRDRLELALDLVRQLLTDAADGLTEDDLEVGWAILADLGGSPNSKELSHV